MIKIKIYLYDLKVKYIYMIVKYIFMIKVKQFYVIKK